MLVSDVKVQNVTNGEEVLSNADLKLTNITLEREIFLRAALQLLDKRENSATIKNRTNLFKRKKKKYLDNAVEDNLVDIIKIGKLRKANRVSKVVLNAEKWNSKIVELRHGLFTYENAHIKWWLRGVKKKVVILSAENCVCREYLSKDSKCSNIFELKIIGGPKRLWMAESQDDRNAWIKAINTAMIGSAGDLGNCNSLVPNSPPRDMDANSSTIASPAAKRKVSETDYFRSTSINAALNQLSGTVNDYYSTLMNTSFQYFQTTPSSLNVANSITTYNGPYAENISRYSSIQSCVRSAGSTEQCRDIISVLASSVCDESLIIPIVFVKRQLNYVNFAMSTNDSLNSKTLQSVSSSQVWKDLQRDTIKINNVLISGETEGPEAMIGCLVRTILEKAKQITNITKAYNDAVAIRSHNQKTKMAQPGVTNNSDEATLVSSGSVSIPIPSFIAPYLSSSISDNDTSNNRNLSFSIPLVDSISSIVNNLTSSVYINKLNNNTNNISANKKNDCSFMSNIFEITEGQVLACARDLLVLCNRTQSGGDTYFCIDALFCNHDYSILTPISEHENPLEITVDLVEGQNTGNLSTPDTVGAINSTQQDRLGGGNSNNSSCVALCRTDSLVSNGTNADGWMDGMAAPISDNTESIHKKRLSASMQSNSSSNAGVCGGSSYVSNHSTSESVCGDDADRVSITSTAATPSNQNITTYSTKEAVVVGAQSIPPISSNVDKIVIPLTYNNLFIQQQKQHKFSATDSWMNKHPSVFGVPIPPVDISLIPPSHIMGDSVGSESRRSSDASAIASAAGSIMDGTISHNRSNSDPIASQTSTEQDQIFRRVPSFHLDGSKVTSVVTAPAVPATVLADDDCMSPFLLPPQFPYSIPVNNSSIKPVQKSTLPLLSNISHSSTKNPNHMNHRRILKVKKVSSIRDRAGTVSPEIEDYISHLSSGSSSSSSSDNEQELDNDNSNGIRARDVTGGSNDGRVMEGLPVHTGPSDASSGVVTPPLGANPTHADANPPNIIEGYNGGAMCIRVTVKAVSKYRLCTLDPQDEVTDTWATITGEFEQSFYIKSNCNGRPVISDRIVKINIQSHVL